VTNSANAALIVAAAASFPLKLFTIFMKILNE
jgi:hypothetical protein